MPSNWQEVLKPGMKYIHQEYVRSIVVSKRLLERDPIFNPLNFKSERQIVNYIQDRARGRQTVFVWKFDVKHKSGFPDLLVQRLGEQPKFIELKLFRGKKPSIRQFSKIQLLTIKRMHLAGMDAFGLLVRPSGQAVRVEGDGRIGFERHLLDWLELETSIQTSEA